MARPDKKKRHRAKREAKRREHRRQESISPFKRLADAPGEIEYWMSENFETLGQSQIFIYKRAAGLTGIACFLVDCGVVGLKDAWSRMHIERAEFTDMLAASKEGDIAMKRAKLDEVRQMVAGGVRWAHDNGMRLPNDWAKTALLIGGVGDWSSADVSNFRKQFVGHPNDLRQRLIAEPFDTYIHRPDISFVFGETAPYLDQDTGEYVAADADNDDDWDDANDEDEDERGEDDDDDLEAMEADIPEEEAEAIAQQLKPAAQKLAADTATWVEARGQTPSTELFAAWAAILLSATMARSASPDASDEEVSELGFELLDEMINLADKRHRSALEKGTEQALEYLQTDPQVIEKAMRESGSLDEPA